MAYPGLKDACEMRATVASPDRWTAFAAEAGRKSGLFENSVSAGDTLAGNRSRDSVDVADLSQ
jgi:hypothetical protein